MEDAAVVQNCFMPVELTANESPKAPSRYRFESDPHSYFYVLREELLIAHSKGGFAKKF